MFQQLLCSTCVTFGKPEVPDFWALSVLLCATVACTIHIVYFTAFTEQIKWLIGGLSDWLILLYQVLTLIFAHMSYLRPRGGLRYRRSMLRSRLWSLDRATLTMYCCCCGFISRSALLINVSDLSVDAASCILHPFNVRRYTMNSQ